MYFGFQQYRPDHEGNLLLWHEADFGVEKIGTYQNGINLATDTFTGSVQRLHSYNSAWVEAVGEWSINGSGKAYSSNVASQGHAYREGARRCIVTCKITFNGGSGCGLIINRVDSSNYWLLAITLGGARFFEQVAGGFTPYDQLTFATPKSSSATINVTLIADGDRLTAVIDSETLNFTEYAGRRVQGTGVGIRIHTDDDATVFDDFTVDTISEASYLPCNQNDSIARWRNRASPINFTSLFGSAPTLSNGINGKPTIKTDSTGSKIMVNPQTITKPCTVFLVGKMWGTSLRMLGSLDNNWLHGWWNGFEDIFFYNQGFLTSTTSGSGNPKCYVSTLPTSGDASFWSGTTTIAESSGTLFDAPDGGVQISGSNRTFEISQAHISSVVIFNSVLNSAARTRVTKYLMNKVKI